MRLRFSNGQHHFGLWVPLFLIGPVVLVFLLGISIILLPFAFLALMFTSRWDWLKWVVMAVPTIHCVVCSLPGLEVDVDNADARVGIVIS